MLYVYHICMQVCERQVKKKIDRILENDGSDLKLSLCKLFLGFIAGGGCAS